MIDLEGKLDRLQQEISFGASSFIVNRAVTSKLHVSPNGNSLDGSDWKNAFQTLPEALAAASVDSDDLTLILLSPHSTYYDINVTGDPTYSGNYIIKGSHRNWAKIINTHASATSIIKFTGKISLEDLTFDPLATVINGVIISGTGTKGARIRRVYFENENVTGAQTALEISGGTEYIRMEDVKIHGVQAHTRGLLLDNCAFSIFRDIDFHTVAKGLQITDAASDQNVFMDFIFNTATLGIDIDAGNRQIFENTYFLNCTEKIDDEVGDHRWVNIKGEFNIALEPEDFGGITVTANNVADTWGNDTELRAAATSVRPFRIVGYVFEPGVAQYYRIRFSHDSGASFFNAFLFDSPKNQTEDAPIGTGFIFNKGTRISASTKALTGGEDIVKVWLKIQEI